MQVHIVTGAQFCYRSTFYGNTSKNRNILQEHFVTGSHCYRSTILLQKHNFLTAAQFCYRSTLLQEQEHILQAHIVTCPPVTMCACNKIVVVKMCAYKNVLL